MCAGGWDFYPNKQTLELVLVPNFFWSIELPFVSAPRLPVLLPHITIHILILHR